MDNGVIGVQAACPVSNPTSCLCIPIGADELVNAKTDSA
jgi:hypothetical protein